MDLHTSHPYVHDMHLYGWLAKINPVVDPVCEKYSPWLNFGNQCYKLSQTSKNVPPSLRPLAAVFAIPPTGSTLPEAKQGVLAFTSLQA